MIVDDNKALAVRFFEALDTGSPTPGKHLHGRLCLLSGRFNRARPRCSYTAISERQFIR
jgi:hypothetical protein